MIRAVLFDMDGVLVDSESFICRAAVAMFSELGVKVVEKDFVPFIGTGENRYIGGVAELYGINIDIGKAKSRTYEIYSQLVRGNLTPLPGATDFIGRCRNHGLKISLATSTDRVKMEINLREIGLDAKSFDSIITGADVVNKKPFPEIYLKAADSLNIPAESCLVVEDAVNGVEAGKRAGCRCLAVTNTFSVQDLKAADWICESLLDVPGEALEW